MPAHRFGFVALIGRPNVGKSTLLNRLTGEKLAIVSPKPQTTRNRILGIVTREDAQVAFLDTPGVHVAKGALHRYMVDTAIHAMGEVDVVLFMIEAVVRPGGEVDVGETNRFIIEKLHQARKTVVLAINKVDQISKPLLLPIISAYQGLFPFAHIFPISASRGEGVDKLLGALIEMLPEQPAMFPEDMVTDVAERFMVEEIIREQVLKLCRQEVPYSTAVVVEFFDESEREPNKPVKPGGIGGLVRIDARIFLERDSQKAIVIGKGGEMLKRIGTEARKEIQKLLGTHVFLSIRVKVESRWSERPDALHRLGYRR